jgi:hypothetical protein
MRCDACFRPADEASMTRLFDHYCVDGIAVVCCDCGDAAGRAVSAYTRRRMAREATLGFRVRDGADDLAHAILRGRRDSLPARFRRWRAMRAAAPAPEGEG